MVTHQMNKNATIKASFTGVTKIETHGFLGSVGIYIYVFHM